LYYKIGVVFIHDVFAIDYTFVDTNLIKRVVSLYITSSSWLLLS